MKPKTLSARTKAAIRAVESAGKEVGEVAFDPDGAIRVIVRDPSAPLGKVWKPV